jgi:hypothetical protein
VVGGGVHVGAGGAGVRGGGTEQTVSTIPDEAVVERGHRWMGDRGAELAGKGDRYLPRGGVRHRTRPNFLEPSTLVAACGRSASEAYWLGTGTQDEYERLAGMPRCVHCIAVEKGERA